MKRLVVAMAILSLAFLPGSSGAESDHVVVACTANTAAVTPVGGAAFCSVSHFVQANQSYIASGRARVDGVGVVSGSVQLRVQPESAGQPVDEGPPGVCGPAVGSCEAAAQIHWTPVFELTLVVATCTLNGVLAAPASVTCELSITIDDGSRVL